jgi:hypothetical protein
MERSDIREGLPRISLPLNPGYGEGLGSARRPGCHLAQAVDGAVGDAEQIPLAAVDDCKNSPAQLGAQLFAILVLKTGSRSMKDHDLEKAADATSKVAGSNNEFTVALHREMKP